MAPGFVTTRSIRPSTMRSRAMHDLWQQKLSCPLLTLDGTRPVEELAQAVLNII